MCAINFKHKRRFVLMVYTSINMTEEEFNRLVSEKAINAEFDLNKDMRLRWHLEDIDQI